MVSLPELYADFARVATPTGLLSAIAYIGRKMFLRTRAERRKENALADIEEATAPVRIEAASITQFEARTVAMVQAWDVERAAKDRAIAFQSQRIAELEEYSASRDQVITELRAQVTDLQRQLASTVTNFQTQLASMARRLEGL